MKTGFAVLVALVIAVSNAHADNYTYTTVDYPGASAIPPDCASLSWNCDNPGTSPTGINNGGTIAGGYTDADGVHRGFVLSNGTYSSFSYPGATGTWVDGGINDEGAVVGEWQDANNCNAFVLSNGTYSSFSYPGATGCTAASGINNAGTIVGRYKLNGVRHGFVLSNGTYTSLTYPGATLTEAKGINNIGTIVGGYADASGMNHGFVLSNGTYTSLDYPGASGTDPLRINDEGTIVGGYADASGVAHGFVLKGGTYTSLDYPGAHGTAATGINNAGTIVGMYYLDADGRNHGFLAQTALAQNADLNGIWNLRANITVSYPPAYSCSFLTVIGDPVIPVAQSGGALLANDTDTNGMQFTLQGTVSGNLVDFTINGYGITPGDGGCTLGAKNFTTHYVGQFDVATATISGTVQGSANYYFGDNPPGNQIWGTVTWIGTFTAGVKTGVPEFTGDFETGMADWATDNGVWAVGMPVGGCHSGTQCAATGLTGNYPAGTDSTFISAPVTLCGTDTSGHIHLTFWARWSYVASDSAQVLIQTYDAITHTGGTWTPIGPSFVNASPWTHEDIDITAYLGKTVRIGFAHMETCPPAVCTQTSTGLVIDDIQITGVTPLAPTVAFNEYAPPPTPSVLTATASPVCGGTLTYLWEALDGGNITGMANPAQFVPPADPHFCPYHVRVRALSDQSHASSPTKTVVVYTRLPGDTNGDHTVNALDLLQVRNHFMQTGTPGWTGADLNCDGTVNALDLTLIRNYFMRTQ